VSKPKYWGAKGGKIDKCMGVSQLLGARARAAPPKSIRLCFQGALFESFIEILKWNYLPKISTGKLTEIQEFIILSYLLC